MLLKSTLQKSEDENKRLEALHAADLGKRDKQIAQLRQQQSSMLTVFGEKYSEWSREMDQIRTDTQRSLLAMDEAGKQEVKDLLVINKTLSKRLDKSQKLFERCEKENEEKSAALIGKSEMLRVANCHISELESQIGWSDCSLRQLYVHDYIPLGYYYLQY